MISDLVYKLVGLVSKGWSWWWEGANKVDKLTPAILSLSFVTLAIFWYQWTSKISRKGTPPLPPGPRGLPLVGYLPFLESDLHRSFSELAHVYGPIMKLQLGYKLCVVLSSPSLAKEVLRDQDITFANRDQPIAALAITYGGLDIAWSQYGPYWRMIRKVCVREMLSNSSLDSSYALRRHEVRKTVRDVYTKIDTPLNISELMFQTVLEVVMSMMWGGALGGGDSSVRAEFREMSGKMVELVGKLNISDLFPILAPFDLQGIEREMKKLLVGIDRIFDPIIDDRLKLNEEKGEQASKNQGNKDLLQFLLKLNEQGDTERPLTRTEMKAILLIVALPVISTPFHRFYLGDLVLVNVTVQVSDMEQMLPITLHVDLCVGHLCRGT
ncbi:hypothetical protein HHK36_020052 [Tetracentron sinense]|uniref:Cytochrome P450 n=1 Tax=Tetracentron sinense TaxID=13715 RepID=A0A834YR01_TETSI|nr:hypothetical protein HHK36_020052 [Tetracentron sinense]